MIKLIHQNKKFKLTILKEYDDNKDYFMQYISFCYLIQLKKVRNYLD